MPIAQPIVDRMPRRTANPPSELSSRVRGGRLVATATNPLPASRCRAITRAAAASAIGMQARTSSGAIRLSAYGAARAVRPNGVVHADHANAGAPSASIRSISPNPRTPTVTPTAAGLVGMIWAASTPAVAKVSVTPRMAVA